MTPAPSGKYTEDAAVEQPAIELFQALGWNHINAYHEKFGAISEADLRPSSEH